MKKDIVKLIEKMAQSMNDPMPAPPPDRKPKQAPSAGDAVPSKENPIGSPKPQGMGHAASSAVRTMQQNLINLASAAAATDATAMKGNQDGQQEGNQSRLGPEDSPESRDLSAPADNKKNYLGGSDPFGKFIVQNYIPNNSFTARQYVNTDVSGQENRENASINMMSLRGIIDTIRRVGSPNAKGEHIPDGVWQTRTNNALHIVGDLIQSFVGLAGDMGNDNAKAMKQVQAYKSILPENWKDVSPAEMNKKAEDISKYLVQFTRFVQSFNEKIVNNPAIKQFIDQKEAFHKFNTEVKIPQNVSAVIPGVHFEGVANNQNWLSLNDLTDMSRFENFLKRMSFGNDPETKKKVLDLIQQKLTRVNELSVYEDRPSPGIPESREP